MSVALAALATASTQPAPSQGTVPGTGMATRFGHVQVSPADLRSAITEGEAAHEAAGTVLGLHGVRFTIVEAAGTSARWGERSADGSPRYVWPFDGGRRPGWQPPPAFLLRHEVGHDLFIRYLVPSTRAGQSRAGQYGGDAPDWLDEMAAIAFEGDPMRAMRRRAAVRHAADGTLIPLPRLLTMVHPELAAGTMPAAGGMPGAAYVPKSGETASFYATAAALYEYLVERTGNSAIVAELARAFRAGERLDHWLPVRTGHGSGTSGLDALNAGFLSWIASDQRYGAGH